jgi:Ca2+-binding RTX toxin-like protein
MVILRGTSGDDVLVGSLENDIIFGSAGNDILIGSSGTDRVDYSNLTTAITLEALGVVNKGGVGTDSIINVEEIVGAFGQANTINGSPATNGITSFDIDLSSNRLTVRNIPNLGNLNFTVENFVNVIGTSQSDSIIGNQSNNILIGRAGNDAFKGNGGNDFIDGGVGRDVAVFNSNIESYSVTGTRNTTNVIGFDGVDTLTVVEILVFDGGRITLTKPNPSLSPSSDLLIGLVDEEFYLTQNPDVAQAVTQGSFTSGAQHFGLFGQFERRDPNALFDTNLYLNNNPDVKQAVEQGFITAAQHYFTFGGFEGRDPSAFFDSSRYLEINTDVAAAEVNPLSHFLSFGVNEGRTAFTAG